MQALWPLRRAASRQEPRPQARRAYIIEYPGEEPTPWGEITTWEDWKKVLRSPGVKPISEYDEEMDIEDFIYVCENSECAKDQAKRQFEAGKRYPSHDEKQALDSSGLHFYAGEFS